MDSDAHHSSAPVHRFILLTDIVQSSRLAEEHLQKYLSALEQHNRLVEQNVAELGGTVYKQTGDGYLVLFETAEACLDAALALGESLGKIEPLADDEPLLVRLVMHAGKLHPSGREYFGPALNRISRICQVCNPGQVLLSGAVASMVDHLPADVALTDLGQHHLRDLAEPQQLFQVDSGRFSRHEFPPLSTLDNQRNNLVSQPNSFIGRGCELRELAQLLLGGQRLLSITAPGGYGKSRLAAQLCANLLHRFEQGVFMAYLAPVRESLDVPTAIANALGYQFAAGRAPEQQLCDYLRAKELLLCLDNFEHLMDSAPLVADLLSAAPKLKIMITSREPLRLEGELDYKLDPLSTDTEAGESSEAELLFADRAALIDRGFVLREDNRERVHTICQQLSGIPLAIELAAAWVDTFALGELSSELSQQLALEARTSNKPARHRSLKACLDWSWQLLGREQQETLMRLSTFRGGFFSEAAAAVLGLTGMALRAALGRLADKSWLYARDMDGQQRFYMRDMLAHEYAFAKLAESRGREGKLFEQAVRAHAQYFSALVEREGPLLHGAGTADGGTAQLAAIRTWRTELDNILEALDTAVGRAELAWLLPVARYLQNYLSMSSQFGLKRERYGQLLAWAGRLDDSALLAQCQMGMGVAQYQFREIQGAQTTLEQALGVFQRIGDGSGAAAALNNLAMIELSQGNSAGAVELGGKALAAARESGDRHGECSCLATLAMTYGGQAEFAGALELLDQALAISRQSGDRRQEARLLGMQSNVCQMQGEYSRAVELLNQALPIFREFGDWQGEAAVLGNLGTIYIAQGEFAQAREWQLQGLAIFQEIGDREGEAYSLGNLATIAGSLGDADTAFELRGQVLKIARETGNRLGEALTLGNLAHACLLQGQQARAAELLSQAIVIYRQIGNKGNLCSVLAAGGYLLAETGRLPQAALCLYGTEHQLNELKCGLDPEPSGLLEKGHALVQNPQTGLAAAERERLKAQAESMSLEELAEFVWAELAKQQVALQGTGLPRASDSA